VENALPDTSIPMRKDVFLHMFFKPQRPRATPFLFRRLPEALDSKLRPLLDLDKVAMSWRIRIIDGPNWFSLSCLFICTVVLFSSAEIFWAEVRTNLQGGFVIGCLFGRIPKYHYWYAISVE
jgi:hypothetical protein